MKNLYYFITECLLFRKPFEGSIIPNWMMAIIAWGNIMIIVSVIIKHI